jgi:hypothetical protein
MLLCKRCVRPVRRQLLSTGYDYDYSCFSWRRIFFRVTNFLFLLILQSLLRIVYVDNRRVYGPKKKDVVIDPALHAKLFTFFLKKTFFWFVGNQEIPNPTNPITKIVLSYYYQVYCDLAFFDVSFYESLHMLFNIHSNKKQYFLTFAGVNYKYFNTLSAGKLMAGLGVKNKGAKKSKKILKYLVDYFDYFFLKPNVRITHYFLKPFNRKNLLFFYEIQKYCKISRGFLGGY